jgi:hypothetical protein
VALLCEYLLAFTLDATRAADTRWYDASVRCSASAPPRPLSQASPVEQAQASLSSGLDVDLVPSQVTSPSLLSFPSFLSFLLQEPTLGLICVFLDESQFRLMHTNGPSRCFPVRSYSWAHSDRTPGQASLGVLTDPFIRQTPVGPIRSSGGSPAERSTCRRQ